MPKNRLNLSGEQVCDALINLIRKNAGARSILASGASGSSLVVDSTVHFQDAEQIVIMDAVDGHVEYHSIAFINDIQNMSLVQSIQTPFAPNSVVQKAIGNVPLPDNAVLFGDREVIPNPDITITVDPTNINSIEWMYLQGGLNVQFNMVITVYAKLDTHDNAIRVVQKYGDYLFSLLINNLHLDMLVDEFLTGDISQSEDEIDIPYTFDSQTGSIVLAMQVGVDPHQIYEIQDNDYCQTNFSIIEYTAPVIAYDSLSSTYSVSTPPSIRLSRPAGINFIGSKRAVFRKRNRYLWNSLVSEVEYGYIQKKSQMYKACKINWWGKEVNEVQFPQVTTGGIM